MLEPALSRYGLRLVIARPNTRTCNRSDIGPQFCMLVMSPNPLMRRPKRFSTQPMHRLSSEGETLAAIAKSYGVSIAMISRLRCSSVDVRFTPKSGHHLSALGCPLCANSGHSTRPSLHVQSIHHRVKDSRSSLSFNDS